MDLKQERYISDKLDSRSPSGEHERQLFYQNYAKHKTRLHICNIGKYEEIIQRHYTLPNYKHPDDVRYPLDMWEDVP